VDDAGLYNCFREDSFNRFWEAFKTIHTGDQHVLDTPILKFSSCSQDSTCRAVRAQHAEPEFSPFGFLEPQAQHVLVTLRIHAYRDTHGINDRVIFPDLDENTIQHKHGIDTLKWPRLPATQARQREQPVSAASPSGAGVAARRCCLVSKKGQIKDLFGLERLPMKGLLNLRALCNLAVVTYCLLVLFNVGLGRPARELKETMYLLT
jgi:hypothetical protein